MNINIKNVGKTKLYYFNKTDSTNTKARNFARNGCAEFTTVAALEQTDGKGRLGRSFYSKKGGVYFSVVLRPDFSCEDVLFITVAAAVSVCRIIEKYSDKKCQIKWVNDIYINSKKVCGILTEGEFGENQKFNFAVLGVGINLFAPKGDFPAELPLADSVFEKSDSSVFSKRFKKRIIKDFLNEFALLYKNFDKKDFVLEYADRSFLNGKTITYVKCGVECTAKVLGIDSNAGLVVETNGKTETLHHGEIQIVGMEQLPV